MTTARLSVAETIRLGDGQALGRVINRFRVAVVSTAVFYLVAAVTFVERVSPEPTRGTRAEFVAVLIAASLLLFVPATLWVCFRISTRWVLDDSRWLREGRPPTPAEQARVHRLPARHAALGAAAAASVCGASLVVVLPFHGTAHAARLIIACPIPVVGYAGLVLLLAERYFGVVIGAALGGPLARRTRIGIVPRLMLAWGQGLAVPLAALLVSPERVGLTALQWSLLGVGLSMSVVAVTLTGKGLSDPLTVVREALERVQGGDLTTRIPPTDGGEVGELQAAFNAMARGLEERARLQELFGRHVGTDVALRAVSGDGRLQGATCEVSVLFVDIVGSTTLARRLEPERLVAALNHFFEAVVATVHAHGGLVNKFEGDAALCVFGAPVPTPDHAARALVAAADLRCRLDQLAVGEVPLRAGIGVATGLVVAGDIGAADRYEWTVIGDAVNQAARVTELAKVGGRALATQETMAGAPDPVGRWSPAERVVLRGRDEPTQLWELCREPSADDDRDDVEGSGRLDPDDPRTERTRPLLRC